jgi:hypothetical protein
MPRQSLSELEWKSRNLPESRAWDIAKAWNTPPVVEVVATDYTPVLYGLFVLCAAVILSSVVVLVGMGLAATIFS